MGQSGFTRMGVLQYINFGNDNNLVGMGGIGNAKTKFCADIFFFL